MLAVVAVVPSPVYLNDTWRSRPLAVALAKWKLALSAIMKVALSSKPSMAIAVDIRRIRLFLLFFDLFEVFRESFAKKNSPVGAEAHFCCFKHFGRRGWWERMSKCMRSAPGELEGCRPGRRTQAVWPGKIRNTRHTM